MAAEFVAEREHLKELIAPVGFPGSIEITIKKLYPLPPEENKHVIGHHVGSWSFVPRRVNAR